MTRILAILCVKDEAAYLPEWLAYHRHIGITDILAFSNDCSDGTDAMLDRLAAMGCLTHIRNQSGQRGPQWRALNLAAKHPLFAQADWILPIDIDEFVNVQVGDGTLSALFAARPQADAFTLTWRLFGNAGKTMFDPTPITRQFTKASPNPNFWPWRGAMFKTLWRKDKYARPGVHRPLDLNANTAPVWVDTNGTELAPRFHEKGLFSNYMEPMFGLVQLNHYAVQSVESFILKSVRGRSNREGTPANADYWVDRNFNQVDEPSIQRHAAALRDGIATLLADPVVADLHEKAIEWRRRKFDEVMLDEPVRDLYARLLFAGESRAISRDEAMRIINFALTARRS